MPCTGNSDLFIHLLVTLIPDGAQLLRGIPKLILMVEFNGQTEQEVRDKVHALHRELRSVYPPVSHLNSRRCAVVARHPQTYPYGGIQRPNRTRGTRQGPCPAPGTPICLSTC